MAIINHHSLSQIDPNMSRFKFKDRRNFFFGGVVDPTCTWPTRHPALPPFDSSALHEQRRRRQSERPWGDSSVPPTTWDGRGHRHSAVEDVGNHLVEAQWNIHIYCRLAWYIYINLSNLLICFHTHLYILYLLCACVCIYILYVCAVYFCKKYNALGSWSDMLWDNFR